MPDPSWSGTPASSQDSRIAASMADSPMSRAPPGNPQVPPSTDHSARCCMSTPRSGSMSMSPAAPPRPQCFFPSDPYVHPSPERRGGRPSGRRVDFAACAFRSAALFGSFSDEDMIDIQGGDGGEGQGAGSDSAGDE